MVSFIRFFIIATLFLSSLLSCGQRNTDASSDQSKAKIAPNKAAGQVEDLQFKSKELALTFDDGPKVPYTLQILEILKKHHIKATFFQRGIFVVDHPEITKLVLQEGHELGSHSWDHPNMSKIPFEEAVENIKKGHAAVEEAAGNGFKSNLFRFPHFGSTPDLLHELNTLGLVPVWSNIQPGDWVVKDHDKLLKASIDEIEKRNHGIVLFHDNAITPTVLDEFISEALKRGYTFRTLNIDKSDNQ